MSIMEHIFGVLWQNIFKINAISFDNLPVSMTDPPPTAKKASKLWSFAKLVAALKLTSVGSTLTSSKTYEMEKQLIKAKVRKPKLCFSLAFQCCIRGHVNI